MRRLRLSPATAISCVALFFSLAGAGLAASRYLITSVTQIKPSVRLALQGQQGPQGQVGPTGPAGAIGTPGGPGATGPQGSVGPQPTVIGTFVAGPSISIPAGERRTASVGCPAGMGLLSGGFSADDGLIVADSRPAGSPGFETWLASASNPTGTALSVRAWAVCASTG